jgi:REP element-mobilizing transposase RayT
MKNQGQRKSIRLKGYNYSQNGYYFVTICTKDRKCMFGDIVDGAMRLNKYGEIAENGILEIHSHYTNIETHRFVVMPNHVHIIISATDVDAGQAGAASAPTGRSKRRPYFGNDWECRSGV